MISLDIFADPICPYCYIGYGNLKAALKDAPKNPFEIHWQPFQLNPQMAKDGMARRAYLEGLFGSRAKAVEAHVSVIQMAEEIGLPLDLGAIDRTPNTFDAHRLVHWAGLEQLSDAVMEGLMAAYWAEGRDIGAVDVLVDVAQKAGMDSALTARLLATDADNDAIIARETHARERGISAAPTFIIDNAHAISGAQPVALWRDVIAELIGRDDGFDDGCSDDGQPDDGEADAELDDEACDTDDAPDSGSESCDSSDD